MHTVSSGINTVHSSPRSKTLLSRISNFAKRAIGILGFSTAVGATTAVQSMNQEKDIPLQSPSSQVLVHQNPVPQALEKRSLGDVPSTWKRVAKKGIGAKDFTIESFGSADWQLLVDEDGHRLVDATKLRLGKSYLFARNEKDAQQIEAAIQKGNLNATWKNSKTVRVNQSIRPETFISFAQEYLGTPYWYGAGNKDGDGKIDCSRLIMRSLWKSGIVGKEFNKTAAGLYDISEKLERTKVSPGNALFFRNKRTGKIEHVGIALSFMQNGYVSMLDASSTTGKVTQRNIHVNSGFLVAALPFVSTDGARTLASSPATVIAKKEVSQPRSNVSTISATSTIASAETSQKISQVIEKSREVSLEETPKKLPVVLAQSSQYPTKQEPLPILPAKAANDAEFYSAEEMVRLKNEISKFHDQRELTERNLARYSELAAQSHPGAATTLNDLKRVRTFIDLRTQKAKTSLEIEQLKERRWGILVKLSELRKNLRSGNENVLIGDTMVLNGARSEYERLFRIETGLRLKIETLQSEVLAANTAIGQLQQAA